MYLCTINNIVLNDKLHILFFASWYPSRILPSNGDFIQRHAEAVAIQHKVTVLHVISDDSLKEEMHVIEENKDNVRSLVAYVKPIRNPIKKWKQFKKAYYHLLTKVDNFDLVHVHKFFPAGYIAYELKKKQNIPYIITEHHTLYHKPYNKKIGFIEKILSKRIVKNANLVCSVSNNLVQAMQDFGLKGTYDRVPNVVDTKRFFPVEKSNKKYTFLHVSSMAKVKNIDGILNAIKILETKMDAFTFQFIGGNAIDFKEKAKLKRLNLNNLEFKNQVTHQEITNYFQQADCFVLFSDVENLPCVILEAFSCGTPVISTNVGGIAEFFPSNFGSLIKARDEKELIQSLFNYANKKEIASKDEMHQYVVENFSPNAICNQFTQKYRTCLKL